ncbi:MAG: CCA tRNA nucleotidyltransferase [archaeon]
MELNGVLKNAAKLVTPSKAEESETNKIAEEVIEKVNACAVSQKIKAALQAGGSVAKGTWLPGISDIDFFLVFDYDTFSERSAELSNYAERILRKSFRVTRLHGSRDYFSAKHRKYALEIVPVLDISHGEKARNTTDYSVLHVRWLAKQIKKNPKLKTEIRLAKQFFKAAGVYGAESYIRGFSGHVLEILVVYYGSFTKLAKSILKWKYQETIDIRSYYKNSRDIFEKLNKSKLQSAIILVDPIEKERNAAAAFDHESFILAKEACHEFFDKPSPEFFKEKKFSVEELKKKKKELKLIVVDAARVSGKPDVIGAALRKKFEQLHSTFFADDFVVQDSGKLIENNSGKFWFYFEPNALPAKKLHIGPPVKFAENARAFRKKWKSAKVKDGRLMVEIKRKYVKPEQLLKDVIKKDKSLSFRVY